MSSHHFEKEVVDGQQSIVIESTLPPTTSLAMLEGEGATVLVFSHDAGLAGVIRGVAAERYPIRIINEWSDLLEQIGSGKGRIVLLDVDALSDDAEDALAEVNRCADWLVMIIAARQQQAQDFMRFWSERRIHRLLIKPAAAGITRLLLESAFARFIELRELHENTDSMEIPRELLEAEEAKNRRRWFWPAIAVTLVAVAGAAVYFSGLLTSQEAGGSAPQIATLVPRDVNPAPQPIAETPRTESPSIEPDEFPDSLVQPIPDAEPVDPFEDVVLLAEAAELRGSFVEPAGDNALDYYALILADAPDHSDARTRLDALLEDQFAIAEAQLLAQDFDAAEVTLGHISRARPAGTRLQFLGEQLIRLRAADAALSGPGQASTEPPGVVEEPVAVAPIEPTELQSMLTLSRLRLNEGLLVEPAGDSARDYLLRALDLGVDAADIQVLAQQFSAQAVGALPQAMSAGNIAAADAMLSTARALGAQTPELAAFATEVDAEMSGQAAIDNAALHAQALRRIDDTIYIGREDSAIALLSQLRERGAAEALTSDLEARLTNALAGSARAAISAGQLNEAEELLAAFEMADLESPVAATAVRDLEIARRQELFLTETAPLGELTLLQAPSAVYPRGAQVAEVTGWVDLHFTVDTTGATADIDVVGAEPEGQFENAAVTALTRWRFEPFEYEERTYERRLRVRMRFELD